MAREKGILLVDDSEALREMMKFNLEKEGYIVCGEASNAIDAMEIYKEKRPELVIMDIMMPDSSGIEAIKKIKADPKSQHIPIIVLSAYSGQKLVNKALVAGAVEYLEKITSEFWEQVTSNEKNMPTAIKAVSMLGSTYLYQLKDCENGKRNSSGVWGLLL